MSIKLSERWTYFMTDDLVSEPHEGQAVHIGADRSGQMWNAAWYAKFCWRIWNVMEYRRLAMQCSGYKEFRDTLFEEWPEPHKGLSASPILKSPQGDAIRLPEWEDFQLADQRELDDWWRHLHDYFKYHPSSTGVTE